MLRTLRRTCPSVLLVVAVLVLTGLSLSPTSFAQAPASTVTEWSAEQRVLLSFHVNDAALQKRLPTGWTLAPSTAPGNPGANLNVTFIDRMVVLDPQGKPLRQGSSRYVVFVAPAKDANGVTNNVIISGISPEGAGAYGVNLAATTSQVQKSAGMEGEAGARVEERWTFATASGERADVQIAYRRAAATKSHAETRLRSAVRPEFTRTYRIDQSADVIRSASSPDRVESLKWTIAGPAYASLFDGSETLLSVTAFPYYVREIAVP